MSEWDKLILAWHFAVKMGMWVVPVVAVPCLCVWFYALLKAGGRKPPQK